MAINRYRNSRVRWTQEELKFIGKIPVPLDTADGPLIDFIGRKSGFGRDKHSILNRRVGAYFISDDEDMLMDDVGEFEITYSFSSHIRQNMFPVFNAKRSTARYGSMWSFRVLYEYLCQVWNYGYYFIDDYFEIMETRPWYRDFRNLRTTIRQNMASELKRVKKELFHKARTTLYGSDGKPKKLADMRTEDIQKEFSRMSDRYGEWESYEVFRNRPYEKGVNDLGRAIREDCIVALSTGQMPLAAGQDVSDSTKAIREQFQDFEPEQRFMASGQLIENLQIFINMDKDSF